MSKSTNDGIETRRSKITWDSQYSKTRVFRLLRKHFGNKPNVGMLTLINQWLETIDEKPVPIPQHGGARLRPSSDTEPVEESTSYAD